jgi:hypothetical protein
VRFRHAIRHGRRHATSTTAAPTIRNQATDAGLSWAKSTTASAAPKYIDNPPATNSIGAGTPRAFTTRRNGNTRSSRIAKRALLQPG